jgi:hypothetical protein
MKYVFFQIDAARTWRFNARMARGGWLTLEATPHEKGSIG